MGITQQFASGTIKKKVAAFQSNVGAAAVFVMKYLGEELAKYAKDNHTYTDQTGNLTGSIGYAVLHNKEIVASGGLSDSDLGALSASKAIDAIISSITSDYSLIIVAGMDYAAYVEAIGYNVILPAELKAKKDFPEAMKKLSIKAKAKAKEIFG